MLCTTKNQDLANRKATTSISSLAVTLNCDTASNCVIYCLPLAEHRNFSYLLLDINRYLLEIFICCSHLLLHRLVWVLCTSVLENHLFSGFKDWVPTKLKVGF